MTRRHKRFRCGGLLALGLTAMDLVSPGILLGQACLQDPTVCPPPKAAPAFCPTGRLAPLLPKLTLPPPNGYYLRRWQAMQVARAAEDSFVIYRNEWFQGGVQPGPYGLFHFNEIARRLPRVPFYVLIQADLNASLNEVRRQAVVQYLTAHGVTDAPARVLIGFPQAEGLFGDEAPRIYNGIIRGGTRGGTSTGGTGGVGGMGGGAIGAGGSLGISSRGY